jgi:acyl-coenzyme A synthetase/AMP-(fatty) acid ligase
MLTSDALEIRADSTPDREIFRCGEDVLTYSEWHSKSSALARSFMRQGVQQQERVILFFPEDQWISYVIALLAVQKIGAIAVSLPSTLPASMAQKIIMQTAARHSVGEMDFPSINRLTCVEIAGDGDPNFRIAMDPDAIAEIVLTSGTSGMPKLVACPHGNLTWETLSAEAVARKFRNRTAQVLSHPLIGSNAAQRVIADALRGAPVVYNIMPSFEPVTVLQLIASRRIEDVALVPARAAALLRVSKGISLHEVRRVHLTSAHTPPWIAEGLARLFPNAKVLNKYGLTEGGRFRIGGVYDTARPSRVGYPSDGHSVRITDEQGNEVPVGTPGKLWVRDPTPYRRFYYREDCSTDNAYPADDWICTNDIAFLDEDGCVTLVGRSSDIANVGGLKVSLREVEEEVAAISGVLDCAAFTLPHRTTGDLICIGIVNSPDDQPRLEEAKTRLARQLGSRFPRLWISVPEIPRTFTGKIEREALAQLALAQFPELSANREQ